MSNVSHFRHITCLENNVFGHIFDVFYCCFAPFIPPIILPENSPTILTGNCPIIFPENKGPKVSKISHLRSTSPFMPLVHFASGRPDAATSGHGRLRPRMATADHGQPRTATGNQGRARPRAAKGGHERPRAATGGHMRPQAAAVRDTMVSQRNDPQFDPSKFENSKKKTETYRRIN